MEKTTSNAFGKDTYLLGTDIDGTAYWLEEAKWDCDWYWGLGYVETYTRNMNPSSSRDTNSHRHFDGMFLKGSENGYDEFIKFFDKTPLDDREIWTLIELMKTLYTLKNYSDTINRGGSHFTTNPCKDLIQNEAEYDRINKIVIPKLLQEVYSLLS